MSHHSSLFGGVGVGTAVVEVADPNVPIMSKQRSSIQIVDGTVVTVGVVGVGEWPERNPFPQLTTTAWPSLVSVVQQATFNWCGLIAVCSGATVTATVLETDSKRLHVLITVAIPDLVIVAKHASGMSCGV